MGSLMPALRVPTLLVLVVVSAEGKVTKANNGSKKTMASVLDLSGVVGPQKQGELNYGVKPEKPSAQVLANPG